MKNNRKQRNRQFNQYGRSKTGGRISEQNAQQDDSDMEDLNFIELLNELKTVSRACVEENVNKLQINNGRIMSSVQREVYRSLRTNIIFTGTENRVIMMTSSRPGEGKSTMTFDLATIFAEAGKKTVLIDADMRKSVLVNRHKILGVESGLSSFLSGQSNISDVTYATNIANFYIIPSGVFPANPTELLINERFSQMIKALKNNFDYVIIDTPPLGGVIDAAIISEKCDGCIMVIENEKTAKAEAKMVVEQLRKADANILGVVLNKVSTTGSRYGYYNKNSYYTAEHYAGK